MQGESRENLSPWDPMRGVSSLKRRCGDSALGSWYTDVFPGFIEKCRDLILEEAGDGNVNGLILTGSFASCEGSIAFSGDGPLFLSDIDLLLVVSSQASHARIYPRRSGIGKACEDLLPGALFEGRVDIGVMTRGELASMPRSPGVFEMRDRGLLLHGTEELFESFPSFGPGEVGPGEALRLLENRMAAFLGDRPASCSLDGKALLKFLYGISRVYTDILTASMCADGTYRPGYGARAEYLDSPEGAGTRERLGSALADAAVRWSRFKIDPDAKSVWTGEEEAQRSWLEAAGHLLAVRDRILRKDLKVSGSSRPGSRDLLRSWKRAAAGMKGIETLRLFAEALASGWEPGERIRAESVRLVRYAVEKGTGGEPGAAPGNYPHGRCSWEEAASMTSARWRRLVTDREDESLG